MKNREAKNQHIYAKAFKPSWVVGCDMNTPYYDCKEMSTIITKEGIYGDCN